MAHGAVSKALASQESAIHRNAPETPDNDSLTRTGRTEEHRPARSSTYQRYVSLYVPVRLYTERSERQRLNPFKTRSWAC